MLNGSLTRLGVVVLVAIAAYAGSLRLDDTIAVFDFRADLNSAATYRERNYVESDFLGSWRVIEDGRLWMPGDAAYRVVGGPLPFDPELLRHARYFLLGRLLPRRQTDSAPWVFCYGCDASTVDPRLKILSDSGDGFVFGRLDR